MNFERAYLRVLFLLSPKIFCHIFRKCEVEKKWSSIWRSWSGLFSNFDPFSCTPYISDAEFPLGGWLVSCLFYARIRNARGYFSIRVIYSVISVQWRRRVRSINNDVDFDYDPSDSVIDTIKQREHTGKSFYTFFVFQLHLFKVSTVTRCKNKIIEVKFSSGYLFLVRSKLMEIILDSRQRVMIVLFSKIFSLIQSELNIILEINPIKYIDV